MSKTKLTLKDLEYLSKEQFHQLWFNEALTDRKIAKMYNTEKREVTAIRKKHGLRYLNSAILMVCNTRYKNDKNKIKNRGV